jgi:hypothetical protein
MATLHRLPDPAALIAELRFSSRSPAADAWADLLACGQRTTLAVDEALNEAVASCWSKGWMPRDLVRVANRSKNESFIELVRLAILAEAAHAAHPPDRVAEQWRHQLNELASLGAVAASPLGRIQQQLGSEAYGLLLGIDLLQMLDRQSRLPFACPPPGSAQRCGPEAADRTALSPKLLERIRHLLQKAERTTFPAEAEAFMSKAQALMAEHSIERAMLDRDLDDGEGATSLRIYLDDPYASAKHELVSAVARANRCRVVYCPDLGFDAVFGFPHDLAAVELLHTSLLVQATAAMTAQGPVKDARGRSRTRSFRASFLVGFAHRIGERLREAQAASTRAAESTHGASLLPVLAGRSRAVDDAVAAVFPRLGRVRTSTSNSAGWAAGRVAADLATLGPPRSLSA